MRITITDVTGREIRSDRRAPGTPGLNRVQWDLRAERPAGRGRGQAAAPGRGLRRAEARRRRSAAAGRCGRSKLRADERAAPAAHASGGGGGGGGRGRGGFAGPPVAPGTYLVKVMIGDKSIGQKTVVVEPDTTFMQNW